MVQQPTSHTPDIFMPTIKRKKKRKKGKNWNPKHATLVFISTDTKLKTKNVYEAFSCTNLSLVGRKLCMY